MQIESIEDLLQYHKDKQEMYMQKCMRQNDEDIQAYFEEQLLIHTQAVDVLTLTLKK